jgi:predicted nucleic acid-binding protein
MTGYLLDTCIVSNLTKPAPSESLITWFGKQKDESLFISTLTIAELWKGVLRKPAGRKRQNLERWFAGPEGPQSLFAGRILPFDERAALIWGEIMAKGENTGKPRSALGLIVAAVAAVNGCIIVTDNTKHFMNSI